MIYVDKTNNKNFKNKSKEEKSKKILEEQYSYDFIPNLNEWLNIDEQKENAERLENID